MLPRTATPEPVDKRDAILAAALELFAERGFHGTAVPLVAQRAGVGAGTIYRYFKSKEALVNALYKKWKMALAEKLLDSFPLDAPPREGLHAFWQRMADFVAEHATAFKFLELHHHGPYLDEASRALEMRILEPARAFLENAQRQRLIKPAPSEILIAVVYGAFVGMVKGSWLGHIELSQKSWDEAEACCWEAIRL